MNLGAPGLDFETRKTTRLHGRSTRKEIGAKPQALDFVRHRHCRPELEESNAPDDAARPSAQPWTAAEAPIDALFSSFRAQHLFTAGQRYSLLVRLACKLSIFTFLRFTTL